MLSLEGQPCRHHFDWDETSTRSPGESVQEAGSELEEEQEAKKGKIDNAIAACHKLCTITYTEHGLCR